MDEERRRVFFESGDADVAELFSIVERHTGAPFSPNTALDFGCGVGRLAGALAKRTRSVIGCDVSPRMLEIARQNMHELQIQNVSFVQSLDDIEGKSFDFITSLIVFQHIPVREGMRLLDTLLTLLAPGGVMALHFTFGRPGGPLRRLGRRLRGRAPLLHRAMSWLQGDARRLPYMQINVYSRADVERSVENAIGRKPVFLPRNQSEIEGALVVARR